MSSPFLRIFIMPVKTLLHVVNSVSLRRHQDSLSSRFLVQQLRPAQRPVQLLRLYSSPILFLTVAQKSSKMSLKLSFEVVGKSVTTPLSLPHFLKHFTAHLVCFTVFCLVFFRVCRQLVAVNRDSCSSQCSIVRPPRRLKLTVGVTILLMFAVVCLLLASLFVMLTLFSLSLSGTVLYKGI